MECSIHAGDVDITVRYWGCAGGSVVGGDVDWARAMALALAPMPELCQRLLGLHVTDGSGRCRACTRAGTGIPAAAWPCAIQIVAQRARLHHLELRGHAPQLDGK
jgi:hypothetical protein